jgi:hypothetical protein
MENRAMRGRLTNDAPIFPASREADALLNLDMLSTICPFSA